MQRPGLFNTFALAERFNEIDPFALAARLSPSLFAYWQAYDKLRKPGRWEEVEFSLLDEETRIQRQSDALRDMFRGAVQQSTTRAQRTRRSS